MICSLYGSEDECLIYPCNFIPKVANWHDSFHLLGKEIDRERKKDGNKDRDLPSVGSLRKWQQMPGLDHAEARRQKIYLGLQCEWQLCMSHPILLSQEHWWFNWIGNGAARTQNNTPMGCWLSGGNLTYHHTSLDTTSGYTGSKLSSRT